MRSMPESSAQNIGMRIGHGPPHISLASCSCDEIPLSGREIFVKLSLVGISGLLISLKNSFFERAFAVKFFKRSDCL